MEQQMNQAALEARIKEIQAAVDQSALNHNALLVRLDECKYLLEAMLKACAETVTEPVHEVESEVVQD